MRIIAKSLISFYMVLVSSALFAADSVDCQTKQCIAVVDAGSSGSRLHIYSFELDKTNSPINIKELFAKKTKPGFASVDANQDAVNRYLGTLFLDAPKNIPVYFFSTAGMRLLPKPKQKQLYGFLENWFNNQSNWQLMSSKTITGSEEGLYGWLAVNYQLQRLQNDNLDAVGVMDMGGASVQISFQIDKNADVNKEDVQEVNIYGRHIKLFTHSFLGLGQNEITHQFLEKTACFSNDYELPGGLFAFGDAYSCEREVASLLNNVHHVDTKVKPILQNNPSNSWYVLGGMAELAASKPFQFTNYQYNNQSLLMKADSDICHQSWSFLSQQYPNDDYLYGYCFFPSYYYALMVDGYGIEPQKTVNYMQPGQTSDWTIGVVLLKPQMA